MQECLLISSKETWSAEVEDRESERSCFSTPEPPVALSRSSLVLLLLLLLLLLVVIGSSSFTPTWVGSWTCDTDSTGQIHRYFKAFKGLKRKGKERKGLEGLCEAPKIRSSTKNKFCSFVGRTGRTNAAASLTLLCCLSLMETVASFLKWKGRRRRRRVNRLLLSYCLSPSLHWKFEFFCFFWKRAGRNFGRLSSRYN